MPSIIFRGFRGLAKKTAAKLLTEYQTLENILDNAEKIKGSIGEKSESRKGTRGDEQETRYHHYGCTGAVS